VLGRAAPHSPDPTPVYAITDEGTGTSYELVSGFVDLEPYVGKQVTIQGVPVPGPGDPSKPPLLNVTQVQPAGGGDDEDPPAVNDKAKLSFELAVEGDPPASAAFYGNVKTGEGGPGLYVALTDPDDDGVYTGSKTVDRFGPGPRPVPPSVEPVSLPVQIVQGTDGETYSSIKDFGTVKLDGDKTFEASVSFDDEEPDPEEISATGRIVEIADYPGASHAITDEAAGGVRYLLTSDSVDLQDYAVSGERVTVYGTPVPNTTGTTILDVTRVEPADGSGEEEVSATGVLERLEAQPVVVDGLQICGLSTHAITDEATGRHYDLKSGDAVDLDAYVGQRVTVHGEPLASPAIGSAGAERCPDLDVTRIERAGTTPPPDNNGGFGNGSSGNGGSGSSGFGGSSGGSSGSVASGIRGLLPSTGGGMALWVLGAGVLMTGGGMFVRRLAR
jgi:hypothetical protein